MTLTCDTAPVTEDDPQLARLREIAAKVAQARQHVTDLEAMRDQEVVRAVGERPENRRLPGSRGLGRVSDVAKAAGLSRQRVNTIVRDAELAAGRPRRPKHST